MPISVTCPSCETRLKVGEHLAGRKVKCPRCSAVVPVSENGEDEALSAKPMRGGSPVDALDEFSPRGKSRRDQDVDDEDQPPDDDKPFDEEGLPRKKKKKKKQQNNKALLIGLVSFGGLLVIGGAILLIVLLSGGKDDAKKPPAADNIANVPAPGGGGDMANRGMPADMNRMPGGMPADMAAMKDKMGGGNPGVGPGGMPADMMAMKDKMGGGGFGPDMSKGGMPADMMARMKDKMGKGGFPPNAGQQQGLAGTTWVGSETLPGYGRLEFRFEDASRCTMIDARDTVPGTYRLAGSTVTLDFQGAVYTGTISGQTMSGTARDGKNRPWTWKVNRQ